MRRKCLATTSPWKRRKSSPRHGVSSPKPISGSSTALVMAGGRTKVKPTPYREGQNVIRDSRSRGIVYMPPEAGDVPSLMKDLVTWINSTGREELPCPLRAAIAHYQFATIHPVLRRQRQDGPTTHDADLAPWRV